MAAPKEWGRRDGAAVKLHDLLEYMRHGPSGGAAQYRDGH